MLLKQHKEIPIYAIGKKCFCELCVEYFENTDPDWGLGIISEQRAK
jgi:hypothetical protein